MGDEMEIGCWPPLPSLCVHTPLCTCSSEVLMCLSYNKTFLFIPDLFTLFIPDSLTHFLIPDLLTFFNPDVLTLFLVPGLTLLAFWKGFVRPGR